MYDRARNVLTLATLAVALGLAGCATKAEVKSASDQAAKAQATAEDAMKKANEAAMMAANAQKTAEEAKAICTTAENKCGRMFEKAMTK